MARKPKSPRWYFSFRSPYSWFAYRDLLNSHSSVAARLEWIPFWEPNRDTARILSERRVELAIVPMSRAKNFYILQDARRLARSRGLTMTWPIDRGPNWEVAHLGFLAASDAGHGREYIDEVYRARWELGLDISDRTVIGEIARHLGLDPDRIANSSDEPEMRSRGADLLERSYNDDMFGVPFFIVGREKFFGVDRLDEFVALMEAGDWVRGGATSESKDTLDWKQSGPSGPAGDGGHAGGCG